METGAERGKSVHQWRSRLRVAKIRCGVQGYEVQGRFIVVRHYRDSDGGCQIITGYSAELKIS